MSLYNAVGDTYVKHQTVYGLLVKWFYNSTAPLFLYFPARTDGYLSTTTLAHSLLKMCDVVMVTTSFSCCSNMYKAVGVFTA